MSLLEVSGLRVGFGTPEGPAQAVDGVSFALAPGATLALVGESGSGKTQTALAILGLLAPGARVSGSVRFEGRELLGLPPSELNRYRGARIGMVFQDPSASLNPHLRIGDQLAEVLVTHRGQGRAQAWAESERMLDALRIADAGERLRQHPHELSGGMRQRVMIAMALLCRPALLVADEPTSALDATVQAQILHLLDELRREFGLALLLITHDLGVVAGLCEQVLVLYGGQLMESGAAARLLMRPSHPYTRALLAARPDPGGAPGVPLRAIPGQPPDPRRLPRGCPFQPRCPEAFGPCASERPSPAAWGEGQRACHASPG